MQEDEILLKVVSDSICMSTYKAAVQGAKHKRVPNDVAENPTIVGHEFCGEIVKVGSKWANDFKEGQRVSIQPALNDPEDIYALPGYSFKYIGGDATYVIVPNKVMELGCLLNYTGDAFFYGSLSEPMACIVGWTSLPAQCSRVITMLTKWTLSKTVKWPFSQVWAPWDSAQSTMPFTATFIPLFSLSPMLTTQDLPAPLPSTPRGSQEIRRRASLLNTACDDPVGVLRGLTGGKGFDDVFVFAPVKPVVEQGGAILGHDGCLNFFAGPLRPNSRPNSTSITFITIPHTSPATRAATSTTLWRSSP